MAHDVNQSEMDVATQVRLALVARISHERYELWMPPECLWHWSAPNLTITAPNDFIRQIARRMLQHDLRAVLNSVVGESAGVIWAVQEDCNANSGGTTAGAASAVALPVAAAVSAASACQAEREARNADRSMMTRALAGSEAARQASDSEPRLLSLTALRPEVAEPDKARPEATVGNSDGEAPSSRKSEIWGEFVSGSSNQMAWTTINMIAKDPGSMTPVLLHGPYGVGKSHLGSMLAHRLRSQRRQRRVVHITGEQFTNDFTEALQGRGLPMLRRKYRDVDSLILDDLQFLLNKKATIGELRHTLDNLLKSGKQVVFLADRPLSELEGLGSDFIGRLRGGMVTPVLPLDEDTRYQILKRDLRLGHVELSDDIVMQIAARAIGDGRLLKGIVKRLMATSFLNEHPLTWDQCWNAVYDLVQATQPIVRLGDIERVVCEVFGLEPNSLQSDRKTRQVSQPRMLAMFLARKYTPAAYQEIGEYFGNRRHSTVISAEKTVGGWLQENAQLQLPRGNLAIRDAMRHVEANLHVG